MILNLRIELFLYHIMSLYITIYYDPKYQRFEDYSCDTKPSFEIYISRATKKYKEVSVVNLKAIGL